MKKLLKRRVLFQVPVDFKAENEEGLRQAIRDYIADPSHEAYGTGGHGYYSVKRGKLKLMRVDK
jgi:hypothetical protein